MYRSVKGSKHCWNLVSISCLFESIFHSLKLSTKTPYYSTLFCNFSCPISMVMKNFLFFCFWPVLYIISSASLHGNAGNCTNSSSGLQCALDIWRVHPAVQNSPTQGPREFAEGCARFHEYDGFEQATLPIRWVSLFFTEVGNNLQDILLGIFLGIWRCYKNLHAWISEDTTGHKVAYKDTREYCEDSEVVS